MKETSLKLSFFTLLIFPHESVCSKEDLIETDPAKIILGKWEMVNKEGSIIEFPNGYTEYLHDSVTKSFNYKDQKYSYSKYWIDSLLHIITEYNVRMKIQVDYSVEFVNNNSEMILRHENLASNKNICRFKRIY